MRIRRAFIMRFADANRKKGFTLVELLASMALLAMISVMVFIIFSRATKVVRTAEARTDQYRAARLILDQMAREIRSAVLVSEGKFSIPDPGANAKGRMSFIVLHAGGSDDLLKGWRTSGSSSEQRYSDQIYFVAPVENSGKQDYCMIGYWVGDVNGNTQGTYKSDTREYEDIEKHSDDILYRYFVTDDSTTNPNWYLMDFEKPPGASRSDQFALHVKSLRIRCWSDYPDQADFTEEWEDEDSSPNEESKVNWDTADEAIVGVTDTLTPGERYDDGRLPKAVKITIVVQDENQYQKEREFSTIVYLDNARR